MDNINRKARNKMYINKCDMLHATIPFTKIIEKY